MGKLNINDIKKNAVVIREPDFSYIDGSYLRKFRMDLKMSQSLFASYLGVSKKAIEKWEQGKNKINPVVARMIYLMQKDSKIFSLIKQVEINGTIMEFDRVKSFNPEEIRNDENVISKEFDYENTAVFNQQWGLKNEKQLGGKNNVSACI